MSKLRRFLSRVWIFVRHMHWLLRNVFLRYRSIEVPVKNEVIRMLPEGHIAEVMWSVGFEQNERAFVANHLKPGMCVLNIGSNSGLYTLIAAKIVGSKGEVHAFEPASINFSRLKSNVKLNGFNNVKINQIAVLDFSGTVAVLPDPAHLNLDSHYFVRRVEDGKSPVDVIEIIACDTIDNYWRNYCKENLKKIDMIIVDVEGAELSVFKGATATFNAWPDLVMMAECTENLDEIAVLLKEHGFQFFEYNEATTILEEINMKRGNIYTLRKNSTDSAWRGTNIFSF